MHDDPNPPARCPRLNRRTLITSAGAAGVAAGLPRFTRAQDATPVASPIPGVIGTLPSSWDQELDVVVIGSGGAAFAAAVTAQSNGAKVALFEKGGEVGGVTAKSGGEYWIPNNSLMKAKGLDDPRDDAMKYMIRLAYPSLYDPDLPNYGVGQLEYDLIATFYDTGSEAVDYFAKIGALQSQIQASFGLSEKPDIADPDYSAQLPEDKAPYGRGLNPAGEAGAGVGLIRQMQAYAKQNSIDVMVNARAVGLFQNRAGEVVGVQIESGGKQMAIRGKRGVIFGTGGFTQDPEKVLRYLRGPIFGGCAVPTNTGDFIDIGSAVGAQLGNLSNAFGVENVVEQAQDNPSLVAEAWMLFGDGMVLLNKYG